MSASTEPPQTITLNPEDGYIIFTKEGVESYIPNSDQPDEAVPDHLQPMFLCMVLLGEGRMPAYVRDLLMTWTAGSADMEH